MTTRLAGRAILLVLLTMSCTEPATDVELTLSYSDDWGIDTFVVEAGGVVRDVPARSIASRTENIIASVPKTWEGTVQRFNVTGLSAGLRVAQGTAELTIAEGVRTRAVLVLTRVCADDGICSVAPDPVCVNDRTLREFSSGTGSCDDAGACAFRYTDTECSGVCQSGYCVADDGGTLADADVDADVDAGAGPPPSYTLTATHRLGVGPDPEVVMSANGRVIVVAAPVLPMGADLQVPLLVLVQDGASWRRLEFPRSVASFGAAVAISANGLRIAVGQPESGRVVVLDLNSFDELVERDPIVALDPAMSDGFGSSLALSADGLLLAVGAPADRVVGVGVNPPTTVQGAVETGAVHIFRFSNGQYQRLVYLKSSQPEEHLGRRVAMSEDGRVLLSGLDGNGVTSWSTRDWQETRVATGSAGSQRGNLAINADGTVALAGSPGLTNGAASLWHRGSSEWTRAQEIAPPSQHPLFGESVALAGDGTIAVVGGTGMVTGDVVVTRAGGTSARLDSNDHDWGFGHSVAVAQGGNRVVVVESNSSRIYIYDSVHP